MTMRMKRNTLFCAYVDRKELNVLSYASKMATRSTLNESMVIIYDVVRYVAFYVSEISPQSAIIFELGEIKLLVSGPRVQLLCAFLA